MNERDFYRLRNLELVEARSQGKNYLISDELEVMELSQEITDSKNKKRNPRKFKLIDKCDGKNFLIPGDVVNIHFGIISMPDRESVDYGMTDRESVDYEMCYVGLGGKEHQDRLVFTNVAQIRISDNATILFCAYLQNATFRWGKIYAHPFVYYIDMVAPESKEYNGMLNILNKSKELRLIENGKRVHL